MITNYRIIIGLVLSSLLLYSCAEEAEFNQEDIYGNWEVIAAKRNNKLTSTLKDAYFKIPDATILETNIFGSDESFDIAIEKDMILQSGDQPTEYKIRMLQNDTLHLSATIQKLNFDFLAVKRDSL